MFSVGLPRPIGDLEGGGVRHVSPRDLFYRLETVFSDPYFHLAPRGKTTFLVVEYWCSDYAGIGGRTVQANIKK